MRRGVPRFLTRKTSVHEDFLRSEALCAKTVRRRHRPVIRISGQWSAPCRTDKSVLDDDAQCIRNCGESHLGKFTEVVTVDLGSQPGLGTQYEAGQIVP